MSYWDRTLFSRKQLLRGIATAGGGLAALSFLGCSDNNSGAGSGEGGGVGASRGTGWPRVTQFPVPG